MMTLEELWENLRQDPEIKATMEEADKSYKLFKKIENLIVADLEAKLDEKTRIAEGYCELFDKKQHENYEQFCEIQELKKQLEYIAKNKYEERLLAYERKVNELKQQLVESESESNARYSAWQEEIGECDRLRVALAEKDAEIEELNHKLNVEQPCLLMNYKDMVDMLKKSQNQTAIEALEKVKESLEDCYGYDYPHLYHFIQSKVDEKIDQQIKKLKGETNNE